jgi:hypothetical protein
MSHRIGEILKSQRRNQIDAIGHDHSHQHRGVFTGFRRHHLVSSRDGVLTAPVRISGRMALAFEAAIRGPLARCSGNETLERPREEKDCHQRDDDLKAAAHSVLKHIKRGRLCSIPLPGHFGCGHGLKPWGIEIGQEGEY